MTPSVIHILDENTANKIAAGEVVERPSSVIKELVENSIDAGSRNIEVEISDGGTSYIRVTDDGIGMSYQDAQLAVLRHATSKIRAAEDLANINSLGFRGEALPSIAAVSRFTLTTRQHDEPMAAYVEINGGVMTDVREAGGSVGTTITVADLFFNTPARKKFLKSISAESSHIHDILGRLALSHPEIAFKLINNKRLVLNTPGTGSLVETIKSLYGHKVETELLPLAYSNEVVSITGYIGKPTLLKSSRQWQTLIVNGRIINSRMVSKALDNAYHSLLPKNGYPLAIVQLTIPTSTIDVNVHPQKSEVKFSDEKIIFKAVYNAVVKVLTEQANPSQLAASVPVAAHPINAYKPHIQQPQQPLKLYQPQIPAQRPAALWHEQPLPLVETRAMLAEEQAIAGITEPPPASPAAAGEDALVLQPLAQIDECFIVAQGADGLYIIDQHAAHERILYDKFSQAADRIPAQQLLVPLLIEFDDQECSLIEEHAAVFYQLGFSVALAGPKTVRVDEMPADFPPAEAVPLLRQILTLLLNTTDPTPQALRHAYLQMAACRAAIKAGDPLNMRQMQALISELCRTTLPYTCPHGRPAMVRFASGELAKMFKRT